MIKIIKAINIRFLIAYQLLCTLIFLKKKEAQNSTTDVLFYCDIQNGENRYRALQRALINLGVSSEVVAEGIRESIRSQHYLINIKNILGGVFTYILFFYIKKFQPKIIVIEIDNLSFHTYREIKKLGVIIVHIAHGLTGQGKLFLSNYYDYYFLWGRSSYKNYKKTLLNFKNSNVKVIMSGPPFFQKEKNSPQKLKIMNELNQENLINIGVAGTYFHPSFPAPERANIEIYYKILIKFIESRQGFRFLYKRHPVGDITAMEMKLLSLPNVLLFSGVMIELAKKSSLVIMAPSCASLECAAVGVPFVIYQWQKTIGLIHQSEELIKDTLFFQRASSLESLSFMVDQRISEISHLKEMLDKFYSIHVERDDSIEYTAETLLAILKNDQCKIATLTRDIS